jgi:NAD-dependent deacetylase
MPERTHPLSAGLKRILVVTGSGISAESGIPTFRGQGGYWRNLDPSKLATEAAFRKDPELVWQWYEERRALIRRSQPNAAHQALVQLAGKARDFLILTQNVDDLQARAEWQTKRLDGSQIVQIHGDIFVTKCSRCTFSRREINKESEGVPSCPNCGAMMRPGVVWFDEELNPDEVARVENFFLAGVCDLVLVIGTTAVFDYIVNWALKAKGTDGRLIEINPEETPLSQFATETFRAPAAKIMPKLVEGFLQ